MDETSRYVEEKRSRRRRGALVAVVVALIAAAAFVFWPREDDVSAPLANETAATPTDSAPVLDGTRAEIEVADEEGRPVADAIVRLSPSLSRFRQIDARRWDALVAKLRDRRVPPDGHLVLEDFTDDLDGMDVEATADAPGFPPTPLTRLTIRAHKVVSVRLVLVNPRSLEVLVLDEETSAPIVGASVVSATECRRRGAIPAAARGRSGPGSAVADAVGRCTVDGLGAGAHDVEVVASGHLPRNVAWIGGELVVRLRPVHDVGVVVVTVFGADRRPARGIAVTSSVSKVDVLTDESGRARFEGVPAGRSLFSCSYDMRTQAAFEGAKSGVTRMDHVAVSAGGVHELTLGCRPGTASIRGRVTMGDAAAPRVAAVALYGETTCEAACDAAGEVRFVNLPSGRYAPHVTFGDKSYWSFDPITIDDGADVETTWALGAAVLRARVVRGSAKEPVSGIVVSVAGPMDGLAYADADGRLTLPGARPGRYEIGSLGPSRDGWRVVRTIVPVPSSDEVLVKLVECGHVKARFAETDATRISRATLRLTTAAGDRALPSHSHQPRTSDAEIRFDDVVPGAWEVEVRIDRRTAKFPVTVLPGKTAVVDVRLP